MILELDKRIFINKRQFCFDQKSLNYREVFNDKMDINDEWERYNKKDLLNDHGYLIQKKSITSLLKKLREMTDVIILDKDDFLIKIED